MKFSSELNDWLCRSQMGTALLGQLPHACRHNHCCLCDLPLDAKNEALPCPHWLIAPYCKLERTREVFANFGVSEVVRYLLIHALSEVRRPSSRNFSCTRQDGRTELLIALRKRAWGFSIGAPDDATFSYTHGRTGFRFEVALRLQEGEAEALAELCRFRAGGLSLWVAPGAAAGYAPGAAPAGSHVVPSFVSPVLPPFVSPAATPAATPAVSPAPLPGTSPAAPHAGSFTSLLQAPPFRAPAVPA